MKRAAAKNAADDVRTEEDVAVAKKSKLDAKKGEIYNVQNTIMGLMWNGYWGKNEK